MTLRIDSLTLTVLGGLNRSVVSSPWLKTKMLHLGRHNNFPFLSLQKVSRPTILIVVSNEDDFENDTALNNYAQKQVTGD